MKRSILTIAIALLLGSGSWSGTAYAKSDFYIRSQFSSGGFIGSHEILTSPKTGYHKARYCNRTFWVSSTTVLWTEEQSESGRTLLLEENVGDNREVICDNANEFATLDDIGLEPDEIDRLRDHGPPGSTRPSRLRIIRDAFKSFK